MATPITSAKSRAIHDGSGRNRPILACLLNMGSAFGLAVSGSALGYDPAARKQRKDQPMKSDQPKGSPPWPERHVRNLKRSVLPIVWDSCVSASAPNTPGNAASAPGSAFNPAAFRTWLDRVLRLRVGEFNALPEVEVAKGRLELGDTRKRARSAPIHRPTRPHYAGPRPIGGGARLTIFRNRLLYSASALAPNSGSLWPVNAASISFQSSAIRWSRASGTSLSSSARM